MTKSGQNLIWISDIEDENEETHENMTGKRYEIFTELISWSFSD